MKKYIFILLYFLAYNSYANYIGMYYYTPYYNTPYAACKAAYNEAIGWYGDKFDHTYNVPFNVREVCKLVTHLEELRGYIIWADCTPNRKHNTLRDLYKNNTSPSCKQLGLKKDYQAIGNNYNYIPDTDYYKTNNGCDNKDIYNPTTQRCQSHSSTTEYKIQVNK